LLLLIKHNKIDNKIFCMILVISLMTLRYSEKPVETTFVKIDLRKLFRIKKQVKAIKEETPVDNLVNE
jgi:hypothetical protein